MSLKALHICFIVLAVGLSIGLGAWALREFSASGDTAHLALGGGGFALAGGLVIYLVWFLIKMRKAGLG